MKKLLIIVCFLFVMGAGIAQAETLIFNGNYLRVGVSESGGLIDDGFNVGIDFDKDGTGTFTGNDFLKPGTPFEFYSVGVNGQYLTAGYNNGNTLGATTVNTSAGSLFSATTTATYNGLAGTQVMSFDINDGVIKFNMSFTNITAETLLNVVYARGLDPDQDVYVGGGYETTNTYSSSNLVTATAPVSDWTIGISTDSALPHGPSISSDWETDPYALLIGMNDGYGDNTINMAWDLGDIAAGETVSFEFEYIIAKTLAEVTTVPEPSSIILLLCGFAGLVGFGLKRKNS